MLLTIGLLLLGFNACKKDKLPVGEPADLEFRDGCVLSLSYDAHSITRTLPVGGFPIDSLSLAEQSLAIPRLGKRHVEACVEENGDFYAEVTIEPESIDHPENAVGLPDPVRPELELSRIEIFNDDARFFNASGEMIGGTVNAGFDVAAEIREELDFLRNYDPLTEEQVDAMIQGMRDAGLDIIDTDNDRYVVLREAIPSGGSRHTMFDKLMQIERGVAFYDEQGELINRSAIAYEGTPDAPVLTGSQHMVYFDSPKTEARMAIKTNTFISNYQFTQN